MKRRLVGRRIGRRWSENDRLQRLGLIEEQCPFSPGQSTFFIGFRGRKGVLSAGPPGGSAGSKNGAVLGCRVNGNANQPEGVGGHGRKGAGCHHVPRMHPGSGEQTLVRGNRGLPGEDSQGQSLEGFGGTDAASALGNEGPRPLMENVPVRRHHRAVLTVKIGPG